MEKTNLNDSLSICIITEITDLKSFIYKKIAISFAYLDFYLISVYLESSKEQYILSILNLSINIP